MKFAVICVFALVAVAYASAETEVEETTYTSKFDNIDVDEILKSDRLLSNYFKCLMEEGRCTAEGNELKKVLPDALATDCSKCSKVHREMAKKIIKFLVDNKPEMWKKLTAKYDPEMKFRAKFEDEAKKSGIKI